MTAKTRTRGCVYVPVTGTGTGSTPYARAIPYLVLLQ